MASKKNQGSNQANLLDRVAAFRQSTFGPTTKKLNGRIDSNAATEVMEAIQRGDEVVVQAANHDGQLKLNGQVYLKGQAVRLDPALRNLGTLVDRGFFVLKEKADASLAAQGRKDYFREQIEPHSIYLMQQQSELAKLEAEYAEYLSAGASLTSRIGALQGGIDTTKKVLAENLDRFSEATPAP